MATYRDRETGALLSEEAFVSRGSDSGRYEPADAPPTGAPAPAPDAAPVTEGVTVYRHKVTGALVTAEAAGNMIARGGCCQEDLEACGWETPPVAAPVAAAVEAPAPPPPPAEETDTGPSRRRR